MGCSREQFYAQILLRLSLAIKPAPSFSPLLGGSPPAMFESSFLLAAQKYVCVLIRPMFKGCSSAKIIVVTSPQRCAIHHGGGEALSLVYRRLSLPYSSWTGPGTSCSAETAHLFVDFRRPLYF